MDAATEPFQVGQDRPSCRAAVGLGIADRQGSGRHSVADGHPCRRGDAGLPGPLRHPTSAAPLGVTIFFFLSGYLITTLLRREFDRNGTISLRAFYLRRACRILPPLFIVLILADLATVAGAFTYQHLRPGALLSQFFFFSNYHILATGWTGARTGTAPGTTALWSLAIEEHFYLLFPAFYLLLRRRMPSPRRQAAVLAGICAAVLLWRFVLILGLHASFDRTYVGTDTRIDSLLFGCILGVLGNPAMNATSARAPSRIGRLWAPVLAPVALVAFLLVYPWPGNLGPALFRHTAISATVQYTIEGLALIPIFIVAVRFANRGVFRLLNHPAVVLVGVLSYSMYISEEIIRPGAQGPRGWPDGAWSRVPHLDTGLRVDDVPHRGEAVRPDPQAPLARGGRANRERAANALGGKRRGEARPSGARLQPPGNGPDARTRTPTGLTVTDARVSGRPGHDGR